jgi:hypothetical protein
MSDTSKKSKKQGPSKAEAIRKAAAAMKAKGEKPRPTVIKAMLAKEGIEVAPAQVSMALKAAGYAPLRKRQSANSESAITLDEMLEAKQLVERFGGVERLLKVVEGLKHFQS